MKKTASIIYKEGHPIIKEKINRLNKLMKLSHLLSVPNKYYDPFEQVIISFYITLKFAKLML